MASGGTSGRRFSILSSLVGRTTRLTRCNERPEGIMHPRMLILALTLTTLTLAACSAQDGSTDQQLTLSVFASDRNAGEVMLLWEGGSPGRQLVQYRYRPQCCGLSIEGNPGQRITLPPEWSDWHRVPHDRSRTDRSRTDSHRFGGLEPGIAYEFQMCYGSSCNDALSDPVAAVAPEAGTELSVFQSTPNAALFVGCELARVARRQLRAGPTAENRLQGRPVLPVGSGTVYARLRWQHAHSPLSRVSVCDAPIEAPRRAASRSRQCPQC